ncbi:acyl carrier protein [Halorhodospira halochloris]|uniref:acyl carrier protein n=1 Tax=Halorhodospira halochloris TaxID=1052 RepID=UPI003B75C11D
MTNQRKPSEQDLKKLIVDATGKPQDPAEIKDGVSLFSKESGIELDSLDGLQISMAIQREYGVRVSDPKQLRRVLSSIESLATFIHSELCCESGDRN